MGDLRGKRLERKVNQARPHGEEGTAVGESGSGCQAELDSSSRGENSQTLLSCTLVVCQGNSDCRDSVCKEDLFFFDQFSTSQSGLAKSHRNSCLKSLSDFLASS